MTHEPIWPRDPLGAHMLKVVAIVAVGTGLWHGIPAFVALGPAVHIAALSIFTVALGAGIVWKHIEAVRSYERGEW